LDASTLLYTVSETAFNMYEEFLLAQNELTNKAVSAVNHCADILKDNQKQTK